MALKSGFAWQKGIFEQVQLTGWDEVREKLLVDIDSGKTLLAEPLPSWVLDRSFVYCDDGAFNPKNNQYTPRSNHPVYERQLYKSILHGEKKHQQEILHESDMTKMIDLGDGVASISFKTKMNVLSGGVLIDISTCLDFLEENSFSALTLLWL